MIALQENLQSDDSLSVNIINELLVTSVNECIDRGITRIKRHNLVTTMANQLLEYASLSSLVEPEGKQIVFDTIACRVTVSFNGERKFNIKIEGNDELSSAIDINCDATFITVNKTPLEIQSIVVMFTSLLLKNSQDSKAQFVEVFTKS